MNLVTPLFYFIIFPGFLFTAVIGLLAGWLDRKLTAMVQWRVGPPWWQNFADIIKLLGKEIIIPEGGQKSLFLLAPILNLAAVTLISCLIWLTNLWPGKGFIGDLIVVLYLLTLPSLAVILGASSSHNPLATLGASREIKLILAYELPFVLSIIAVIIKTGGMLKIGDILNFQHTSGVILSHWSGILAFIAAILCLQAKLGLVPFDMAEAETEIMSGVYIEYSGPGLAIYKLAKAMALVAFPMFLVVIFMGGITFRGWPILWGILKYVGLLALITLIRNTNPRVRIDQAVHFFWGPVTILAVLSVILAILGK